MSGQFTFPPPPPPPPRKEDQQSIPHTQSGPSSRGSRGGLGRGRGSSHSQRGRFPQGRGHSHGHPAAQQKKQWPSESSRGGKHHVGPSRAHEPKDKKSTTALKPSKTTTAPPVVPSFGFSLPVLPTSPVTTKTAPPPVAQSKKRKFNQLGLTPRSEEREDSDNDIDEEAVFAANSHSLTFVFNGKESSLNSSDEVREWLKERRAKYPTKARIAQNLKDIQPTKVGRSKGQTVRPRDVAKKHPHQAGQSEKEPRKQQRQCENMQRSEKRLAKAEMTGPESSLASAPPALQNLMKTLGINYSTDKGEISTDEDDGPSSGDDISSDSTSSWQSDSSSDASVSSEEDEAPREQSSKLEHVAHEKHIKRPRGPKPPQASSSHSQQKRVRLYDRLLQQEEEQADVSVLRFIKYLGDNGHLDQ